MTAQTRLGWRLAGLICALTIALALGLSACGGGDDSTSSEASTTTAATTAPSGQDQGSSKQMKSSKKDGGKGSGKSESSAGGGESHANAAPLKVSGGGSAQFKVKGGDNSVQEYGAEAGGSELRETAELVHSFYVARVAREWAKACSYLAKSTVEGFEELAASSPKLQGKGCAAVFAALFKPVPPSLQRQLTTVDAAALRSEGEQGFLIYTGPPGKTVYSMPLRLEGGEWRVAAVSGAALPGAKAP